MTPSQLRRAKDFLTNPKYESIRREVTKRNIQRYEDSLKQKIVKYFPEHKDHSQEEISDEYFDAMFVSLKLKCSCGQELIVTRGM